MFKKAAILLMVSLFVFSCAKKDEHAQVKEEIITLNLAEVIEKASDYVDKTVEIKGIVSHVCRKSGKKLFLIGGKEGQSLKITAGANMSGFDINLEGSEVIAKGIIRETKVANTSHEESEKTADEVKDNSGSDSKEIQDVTEDCATDHISYYSLECESISENK